MKKIYFIVLLSIYTSVTFAQYPLAKSRAQLNAGVGFSGWGLPLFIGFDYGVHKDVSIGGEVSFRNYSYSSAYSANIIGIFVNGNYHFNSVLNIPKPWDFYGGANLGFFLWTGNFGTAGSSGLGLGIQVGGRYYFNDKFGINLEFGGGNYYGGKVGITYKF
ncbi:MAG: hypothetical protein NW207_04895 [Cytophagales bacterium]|nr:hypothetical protein [Cytophagales bacterium]